MRCGHMSMRNPFTLRGRPLSRHDQERLGVPVERGDARLPCFYTRELARDGLA